MGCWFWGRGPGGGGVEVYKRSLIKPSPIWPGKINVESGFGEKAENLQDFHIRYAP